MPPPCASNFHRRVSIFTVVGIRSRNHPLKIVSSRSSILPHQLQPELNLPCAGGSAGDHSCGCCRSACRLRGARLCALLPGRGFSFPPAGRAAPRSGQYPMIGGIFFMSQLLSPMKYESIRVNAIVFDGRWGEVSSIAPGLPFLPPSAGYTRELRSGVAEGCELPA